MRKTFRWFAVAALTASLLAACSTVEDAATLEAQKRGSAAPATYLVVTEGTLAANLPAVAAANRDELRRFYPDAGFATVVTADPNAYRRFGTVTRDITVQWIEPGQQVALDIEYANPPFSGDDDFYFDLQWGHDAVNAPEAWNAGVRGAGVRVAVLDTGFDLDHPDLAPNINLGLSEDMTGEGLQYTLPDPFSHGTHTAGTVAAADNAFGTIGVAPEAELVLVKVLGDEGSGTFEWVMSGIVHAADVDADIINMSLGALMYKSGFWTTDGEGNDVFVTAREVQELRTAMQRVIRYATQQGTLVVASAGNAAIDFDHAADLITLPGSAAGVVTVGATAPVAWATDPGNIFLDNLASYSNFGRSHLDFGAPGGDFVYPGNEDCTVAGLLRPCWVFDLVFSTGNNGWYWSAGTSMAAPHVAGVAALILSEFGGSGSLTPAQLEAELRARADDLGQPGNDPEYGMGRVATGY
jgi:lantibiotic leader peptide-processing serine protease